MYIVCKYRIVNIVRKNVQNELVHDKVARCQATLYVRVKFLSCNPLCGRVPHLRYKVTWKLSVWKIYGTSLRKSSGVFLSVRSIEYPYTRTSLSRIVSKPSLTFIAPTKHYISSKNETYPYFPVSIFIVPPLSRLTRSH